MKIVWKSFDYDHKDETAPEVDTLVWIVDDNYFGVTLGYFDGFTMRTWNGDDDCSVLYWASIVKPAPPRCEGTSR